MDEIMFVLELIGAAAFAVSGAMVAIEKRADIFGVLFLAVTTALGGGVIRDVLIGRIPPVMFVSYWYLLISVVAALAVFIDAYLRSEKYKLHLDKLDAVNNIFDAIGLAVFTVSGMNAAMPVSDNVILVLFVGMCTGVGGGMLRDVMTNTMPKVLRKRVYAVASLLGGGLYYAMYALGVNQIVSLGCGMLLIFALRLFATIFKWNLPSVKLD
ncbi:MAG: trimeric intracellular cation channel family protein [Clostridiales bacterium]|nr:trimeric intracellular cation channel family protein [Clostridiales bacterium]MDY4144421.1 trimeric intracellular cation channel family protein [Oscillospiraceae bacterium]